jgi:glucosamine-6-phosphate deaminase
MGTGTLLRARHVVLMAMGNQKANVVARALEGPITTKVPASLLQAHPNVTVVLDRAAAAKLST